MQNTILAMHVLGAVLLGLVMLLALRDLYTKEISLFPSYVRKLSLGLFFEIATGSALAMLTPGFPISAFCQNIAVYVLVVALFIFLIYHGLAVRQKLVLFPRRFVGVTTLLSAVSTLPVFVSALV